MFKYYIFEFVDVLCLMPLCLLIGCLCVGGAGRIGHVNMCFALYDSALFGCLLDLL